MLGLLLRDAGGACFFPPAGHRLARKQKRHKPCALRCQLLIIN